MAGAEAEVGLGKGKNATRSEKPSSPQDGPAVVEGGAGMEEGDEEPGGEPGVQHLPGGGVLPQGGTPFQGQKGPVAPLGEAGKAQKELLQGQGRRPGPLGPAQALQKPPQFRLEDHDEAKAPRVAALPRSQDRVERPRRLAVNQTRR